MTDTLIRILPGRGPSDAYGMHQAVAAATAHDTSRVLWAQPAPNLLIIRAATIPDWGVIQGATGCETTTPAPPPSRGDRVDWALIANPTKVDGCRGCTHPDHHRGTGRRIALPETAVPAWAVRKLVPAIDAEHITCERLAPARGRKRGHLVTHTRYAITGAGTVTDQAALAELMRTGIGPGKAFGCGLLQYGAAS